MDKNTEELFALVEKATAGDREALETLIAGVQDLVFNLSLRMLGTFADAEDATQDILLKVITHLSSFKRKAPFPHGCSALRQTISRTTRSTCSPNFP